MTTGPEDRACGLDARVVRAYDIRGHMGRTLWARDAWQVGRAFGVWLKQTCPVPRVCVVRDGRVTSPELMAHLVRGLRQAGCCVLQGGLGPTPMMYAGVHVLQADGGIMITASHNPAGDNGFKICLAGRPFFGDDLKSLDILMRHQGAAWHPDDPETGTEEQVPMLEGYLRLMEAGLRDKAILLRLKVAWDPGHGAAGPVLEKLLPVLPGTHTVINGRVDGTFPAHPPDPTHPQHLAELARVVRGEGCDVGLAFDGDADRLGVVDATGEFVPADVLLALYAEDVLARNPGARVIVDIKTSDHVGEVVHQKGGEGITCRTGHSFIKQAIRETGALLAGELSGHFFFADRYKGFDDGLYAALRLLEILAEQGPGVLVAARAMQAERWPARDVTIPVPEGTQFETVGRLVQWMQEQGRPFENTDGVKARTPAGWWLLRASNTESKLVGRCEARAQADLAALQADMHQALAASSPGGS
jgi:phosphomannomutase